MAGYSVTYTVIDNATKSIDQINRRIAAMRAPIERLGKQVSRFVDVSGLRKVAQGFGWIRNAAMGVIRSLVQIIPLLGTITGAATLGGMIKLVSSFASWQRQLTITADSLGMTTEQVQVFENAIRLVGGSAQDAESVMASLFDTASKFIRGETTPALTAFLGRLNINFRDATGHMRAMSDLLPEVIDKIAAIANPSDRAAAAQALLGANGMKIVESFRAQHTTMAQAQDDARKYATLTEAEKRQLDAFYTAQNKAGVAFDTLGQKIAALSADHLTPLVNWFTDFVDKHQPEILLAVGTIEDKFAEWTERIATWLANPGNWDALVQNLKDVASYLGKIVDALKWIADNAQWFINPSKKLGLPENTIGNITHPLRAEKSITDALSTPPSWATNAANWMRRQFGLKPLPGTGAGGSSAAPATNVPKVDLPGDYSWGDYGTRANNPGNMNAAPWQRASGKFSYTDPQTGGQHTMAVYKTMQEGIADTYRLLERNQAQYGKTLAGALHGWAENSYVGTLAKSLNTDANAPFDISTADPDAIASMMDQQFKREGRRGSHSATREQILAGIGLARGGQDVAAVPPAAPVKGSVDVSITHKNPPPDSAVTAKGTGQVNVAPPKVEHQDFASI